VTSNSVDAAHALRLQGVAKHYGRGGATLKALDGVDLAVPRGQLLGLIGHNGAGKSTLFKLVLGLIAPSAGQLWVDGCEVGGRHFREARRRLGYLPENLVLYDNLDGLETLRFFARLKGAPLAQCPALLEEVGLSHAGRRPVREYSKGMRQRLGFAQALLGEPQLLLLDEPTTGLDPSSTGCARAASRWSSARTSWPSWNSASMRWLCCRTAGCARKAAWPNCASAPCARCSCACRRMPRCWTRCRSSLPRCRALSGGATMPGTRTSTARGL
jgi:ABC-type Na+ transport system ATPase subunit NatA